MIALRNRLIHGHSSVSNEVVWGIIERHLSPLRSEVEALLEER
ncbi:MAG TPA: HepT-like ribonuclease domain-containing protein [Actinomycetota bacterium]|nr:HepT-like ribonuclease domain-containing protein [Actinomycetota bacterium]